jgi:hypothetical protein
VEEFGWSSRALANESENVLRFFHDSSLNRLAWPSAFGAAGRLRAALLFIGSVLPVLARMRDDPQSVQRQRIYRQALRKMCPDQLRMVEGRTPVTTSFQRLVEPIAGAPRGSLVQVHKLFGFGG